MTSISKFILAGFLMWFLTSCSKKESSNLFIEINTQKVELQKGLTVKELRKEILKIAWKNWQVNNRKQTDWCNVYSISHKNNLGIKLQNNQVFTNKNSIPTFRLIKKKDGIVVVEEQTLDNSIRAGSSWMSSGNEVNKTMFDALLGGILNDSILKCVLRKI